MSNTRELYDKHVIPTYGRFDLRLARGRGSEIWDEDGKRYLDWNSQAMSVHVGHQHPKIIDAIRNGKRPDGSIIGPPMPIMFYRGLADDDLKAVIGAAALAK